MNFQPLSPPPYSVLVTPSGKTDSTDSTAIQAAINSLATTGGLIRLKGGTYTLTSTLNINQPKSGITIQGEGSGYEVDYTKVASATTLYCATDIGAVSAIGTGASGQSVAGFVIRDLNIQGPYTLSGNPNNSTVSTKIGLFLQGMDLPWVQNVGVRQFNNGVIFHNVDAGVFLGNNVQDCNIGFQADSGTNDTQVLNNVFSNFGPGGFEVYFTGAIRGTVNGNYLVCHGTDDAIEILNTDPGLTVTSNRIRNANRRSIRIYTTSGLSRGNIIASNFMQDLQGVSPSVHINVGAGCSFTSILSNMLYDSRVNPNNLTLFGIYEDTPASVDHTRVVANTIDNMKTSAVSGISTTDAFWWNAGYNPIGLLALPLDNTNNLIGPMGTSAVTALTSTTVYTCQGAAVDLYLAGGTVTLVAKNGNTLCTSLPAANAPPLHITLNVGDTFNITFSVIPTTKLVFGL